LKDAPILILDEPTSSVDVETEAVIMEAMERLMLGRTSFMIAHRLSTLDACERRLQIDHGEVADGTPVEAPPSAAPALNGARTRAVAPRRRAAVLDEAELEAHPAIEAWTKLNAGPRPRAVDVLRSPKNGQRAAAYRLRGCGPDGMPVIAKHCPRAGAEIEGAIYRDVLPHLPVPALRYQGMLDEGGERCWIFVEDAGAERYSPLIDEHRRIAARWLAELHRSAVYIPEARQLPDRGPNYYLARLHTGRDALIQHVCDQAPKGDELRLLSGLVSQLDTLESRWRDVSAFCETLPSTLVHGDFLRKNLRVRPDQDGADLVAFDWENAGWGVPATDLAHLGALERLSAGRFRKSRRFYGFCADPSLETYASTLRSERSPLPRETIELAATVGTLFRCVVSIDWLTLDLDPGWTPVTPLDLCSRWLEDAMHAGGWNGGRNGDR
jgi:thiamine kinase-like enzyme